MACDLPESLCFAELSTLRNRVSSGDSPKSGVFQACERVVKGVDQRICIGFGVRRAGQQHVVEGGQQHAAIEQRQLQRGLQRVVEGGAGLAAVARAFRCELHFAARADARHRPAQTVVRDHAFQPVGHTVGNGEHLGVGGLGHHVGQHGAHQSQGEQPR